MTKYTKLSNKELRSVKGDGPITLTIGGIIVGIAAAYGGGYAIGEAIGYYGR